MSVGGSSKSCPGLVVRLMAHRMLRRLVGRMVLGPLAPWMHSPYALAMTSPHRESTFDARFAATRIAVVVAFCAAHAAMLALVASPVSQPLLPPIVMVVLVVSTLIAMDLRQRRERNADGARSMVQNGLKWGMYLMAGSAVLGVANVWYAAADPGRAVLPSVGTFAGSLLVAGIFAIMAATDRSGPGS